MTAVIRLVWLAALWVLLWQDLSVANVASGLLVALAITTLFRGVVSRRAAFRPLRALHFAAYFIYKLVESTATLAWEVVTPQNRLNRGIIAVPLRDVSDGLATLIANAISLTPGTLTLDVQHDPTTLFVHVLHLRDSDAVRADIHRIATLAVRAFGPRVVERPA